MIQERTRSTHVRTGNYPVRTSCAHQQCASHTQRESISSSSNPTPTLPAPPSLGLSTGNQPAPPLMLATQKVPTPRLPTLMRPGYSNISRDDKGMTIETPLYRFAFRSARRAVLGLRAVRPPPTFSCR